MLAQANQLPPLIATVHARYGTPWVAVVLSSVIYSTFAAFSFRELIVLNNWLYSLSLLVELAAFLALRRREPGLARPWRVPGGQAGALTAVALPSALALLAMATAGLLNTAVAVAVALTGPLVYLWVCRASGSRR